MKTNISKNISICLLGIILLSCNSEKKKLEAEIETQNKLVNEVNSKLSEVHKNYVLIGNNYWHKKIADVEKMSVEFVYGSSYEKDRTVILTYLRKIDDGIGISIDTSGGLTLEIHRNLKADKSSKPDNFFWFDCKYYTPKGYRPVTSGLAQLRYDVVGDSTFIKKQMNKSELEKAQDSLASLNWGNGTKYKLSEIETEHIVGVFSTTVLGKFTDEKGVKLDLFIEEVGRQLKENPNTNITITYGYSLAKGKENEYTLNEIDKAVLLDAYYFYPLINQQINLNKNISRLKESLSKL